MFDIELINSSNLLTLGLRAEMFGKARKWDPGWRIRVARSKSKWVYRTATSTRVSCRAITMKMMTDGRSA